MDKKATVSYAAVNTPIFPVRTGETAVFTHGAIQFHVLLQPDGYLSVKSYGELSGDQLGVIPVSANKVFLKMVSR